jgi:hypothetical protein
VKKNSSNATKIVENEDFDFGSCKSEFVVEKFVCTKAKVLGWKNGYIKLFSGFS